MLISTNLEFRLHNPSNAIDEVSILQGIIDNSEKDFLRDKVGGPLYDKLCEYYKQTTPEAFYQSVTDGDYVSDPYAQLLLYAQRMIVNDALVRYAYQQVVSVNGSGMNMSSSDDYAVASDKVLDKAVQRYRKESLAALNTLLILLEEWAKKMEKLEVTPSIPELNGENDVDAQTEQLKEIVTLWKQSRYYYLHGNLLIPTCSVLQNYLNIYDNRDKFICLLPDLLFIQEEYIEDAIGEERVQQLLHVDESDKLLKKVRRLMVAYLEERTTVLTIDKTRRVQAHNEGIALKSSVLSIIEQLKKEEGGEEFPGAEQTRHSGKGYKNNQPGTRMFVSPLLY